MNKQEIEAFLKEFKERYEYYPAIGTFITLKDGRKFKKNHIIKSKSIRIKGKNYLVRRLKYIWWHYALVNYYDN